MIKYNEIRYCDDEEIAFAVSTLVSFLMIRQTDNGVVMEKLKSINNDISIVHWRVKVSDKKQG